jgi:hypothetical protein
MKKRQIVFAMAVLLCATSSARAWNAVALLEGAPADSGVSQLRPASANASTHNARGDRMFFLRAATWADIVRDQDFAQRREKYHRGHWHYINFFWEESGPNRTRERTDLKPQNENAVERLQLFTEQLRNENSGASSRSIALVWVLHLVGDVHQPLHTSARVTRLEPQGDRGGNEFKLAGEPDNLHAYWDFILDLQMPRRFDESQEAFINRLVAVIVAQHSKSEYSQGFNNRDYKQWAREGFFTARTEVYRGVERHRKPTASYRRRAFKVASRAVALAGYRLADLLNRSFDSSYSLRG